MNNQQNQRNQQDSNPLDRLVDTRELTDPDEQRKLRQQSGGNIVGHFIWFGVLLMVLSVIGFVILFMNHVQGFGKICSIIFVIGLSFFVGGIKTRRSDGKVLKQTNSKQHDNPF